MACGLSSSRSRGALVPLILSLLVALLMPTPGNSFAAWMTKDFCDRHLEEGEIIMNEKAILTNERFVRVFRGEEAEELVSGKSVYVANEVLNVQISDSTGQFVLEAHHAEFVGGGCKKKNRVSKNHAVLKMPESGAVNVTIQAGWAMGHQEVHLTPSFLLIAPHKRKPSVPGAKKSLLDHHRAIGSAAAALDKISALVHDASKSVKASKLLKKITRRVSKGGVKVEADFETKEEHDAEHEEEHEHDAEHEHEEGHGKKKGHWRHAAKIIEKKLRGAMEETEEIPPLFLAAGGVALLVLVFCCYSCVRANRFRFRAKNHEKE